MKLQVIPQPNTIKFLGGNPCPSDKLEITEKLDLGSGTEEGYELTVRNGKAELRADSSQGMFYARQTLAQLTEAYPQIDNVCIKDKPRYSYRGFMLDCARHMTSVPDIKKLVDVLAMLKLNVLHWHLTDDQGWRIESERYPELNTVSAYRKSSDFGGTHVSEQYGGFYTKAEISEVVNYCADRFIKVVPEIDMPGHVSAILAAFPGLSCRDVPVEVKTCQGIFPDVFCAGKDVVLDFIFSLLDEICELFPSDIIHIGGDETPKKYWSACPDCQRRMAEENFSSEDEMQAWFMNKIAGHLSGIGRHAVIWNDILKCGAVDKNIIVQRWMEHGKSCIPDYLNGGGKVIMSDFYHCYLDYPYGMTSLKKTYGYNPVPAKITHSGKKNIIGVEAPVWTEYISDFNKLSYMVFPRLAAVAEVAWTEDKSKNYDDFSDRLTAFSAKLKALGIQGAARKEWNPAPPKATVELIKFFSKALRK